MDLSGILICKIFLVIMAEYEVRYTINITGKFSERFYQLSDYFSGIITFDGGLILTTNAKWLSPRDEEILFPSIDDNWWGEELLFNSQGIGRLPPAKDDSFENWIFYFSYWYDMILPDEELFKATLGFFNIAFNKQLYGILINYKHVVSDNYEEILELSLKHGNTIFSWDNNSFERIKNRILRMIITQGFELVEYSLEPFNGGKILKIPKRLCEYY